MKRYLILSAALLLFMLFLPLLAGHPAPDSGVSHIEPLPDKEVFLVLDRATGQVLTLPVNEYLCSVVAAEMPTSFHEDALRAQACACYTLAYRKRAQQLAKPDPELNGAYFSVDSTARDGLYAKEDAKKQWGDAFDEAWGRIEQAVAAVENNLIVSNGEPILAAFHAISPGLTESAQVCWGSEVSYLQPVNSEWDRLRDDYETVVEVPAEQFRATLAAADPPVTLSGGSEGWITDIKTSPSGTVTSISVGGTQMTGKQLRTLFSLRSACFTVTAGNNAVTFTVHGYGHGAGMSQVGADYLARQGTSWQDILTYYYPGTEIRSVS